MSNKRRHHHRRLPALLAVAAALLAASLAPAGASGAPLAIAVSGSQIPTPTPTGHVSSEGPGQNPGPQIAVQFGTVTVATGGKSIGLKLTSPDLSSGVLTGQTKDSYAVKGAKHKAPVSLGTARFTLKASKGKAVELTLSKVARKLLVAEHTLKVRLSITLTSPGHTTTAVHFRLTLKLPKR